MKRGPITVKIAFCLLGLALTPSCAKRVPRAPSYRIDVSSDLQKVSIHAKRTPLATLLHELSVKHGVEVRLNQPANPFVSAEIEEKPLDEAISAIVPKGVRFALRTGEREWAMSPHGKGGKQGAAYPDASGKPEKGKLPPVPTQPGKLAKARPEAVPVRTVPTGQGFKVSAAMLMQVPSGRGPKKPTTVPETQDKTLRLRFTMMLSGEIRLDSAVLIDGATAPTNRVVGPMLYAIRRANGSLVSFGTFEDPLVEHSYLQEDGKHGVGRAKEGSFGLSLPGTLAREGLQGSTIQFYQAGSTALPPVLDEKTFSTLVRKASRLKDVGGAEVVRIMREARQ